MSQVTSRQWNCVACHRPATSSCCSTHITITTTPALATRKQHWREGQEKQRHYHHHRRRGHIIIYLCCIARGATTTVVATTTTSSAYRYRRSTAAIALRLAHAAPDAFSSPRRTITDDGHLGLRANGARQAKREAQTEQQARCALLLLLHQQPKLTKRL